MTCKTADHPPAVASFLDEPAAFVALLVDCIPVPIARCPTRFVSGALVAEPLGLRLPPPSVVDGATWQLIQVRTSRCDTKKKAAPTMTQMRSSLRKHGRPIQATGAI